MNYTDTNLQLSRLYFFGRREEIKVGSKVIPINDIEDFIENSKAPRYRVYEKLEGIRHNKRCFFVNGKYYRAVHQVGEIPNVEWKPFSTYDKIYRGHYVRDYA